MKALILNAEQKTASVQDIPIPMPGSHDILIKVQAIALNPIDPLYVRNPLGSTGRTIGSDFAGTIALLGDSVLSSSSLKVGDRVAGFVQGACSVNERPGAFAEYVISPWDLVWRIPDNMSLEEAATMSLCGLTAAQALFPRLGLEFPFSSIAETSDKANEIYEEATFLIYGASTSVGLFAAQLIHRSAKSTGRKIKLIGVASKARWEMLRSKPYEYNALIDYKDPNWTRDVLGLTNNHGVDWAFDCISEGSTVQLVSSTLSPNGKISIVRSRAGGAWKADNLPTEPIYGAVWEGLGVDIQYQGMTVPASPEARAFAVSFFKWLSNGGDLAPNKVRIMPGGLEKVVDNGFVLLGAGGMGDRDESKKEPWMRPVAAEKLVYRIDNQ